MKNPLSSLAAAIAGLLRPQPDYIANFVSGVSPDAPDARDYVWQDRPGLNLPAAVDHSHNVISIENQGPTSSCVAHSGTSILEAAKAAAGQPRVQLSRLHLYWHARDYSASQRGVDAGTTLRNALKAMYHCGAARESDWPFAQDKVNEAPPAAVDLAALPNNVKRYERLKDTGYQDWAVTCRRIKEALATGHMVYVAMALDRSFYYLGAQTPHAGYKGCTLNADADWIGNHAMAIVGYYSIGVSDYVVLANSWGSGWGAGGYAHLPAMVLAYDSFDIWAVTEFAGTEVAAEFARRLDVAKLYVSIFGRAPDAEGLHYWSSRLAAGESFAQLADAMYACEPARKYYPQWLTAAEVVDSFYRNVLGRQPDAEGLAYWTGVMHRVGFGPTVATLVGTVFDYRGTDAAGIGSRDLFIGRCYKAVAWAEAGGGVAGAEEALS